MKTVFLFPGQGAQYPGMGKDFYDNDPKVRQLFDNASDICGRDWAKIIFEGTDEQLRATDVTQVAIILVSLAASMALKDQGIKASACAGFSLGEFSALHIAGVLGQDDLLRIVFKRGELLERVSRSKDTADGAVGLMAVLGLEKREVETVVADIQDVYVAIHSSNIQTVIAGTAKGLADAEKSLNKAGAMKTVPVRVSGPFHSPLLSDARVEFGEILSSIEFRDPQIPVFVNTTARAPKTGADARKTCIDQIDHQVKWVDCQKSMMETNPERVLEVGPGNVLTGIWKSMRFPLRAKTVGTLEEVRALA